MLTKREAGPPTVDPERLRSLYGDDREQWDVLWYYSKPASSSKAKLGAKSRGGRSSGDEREEGGDQDAGQDAYGFVVLDGPQSSIDHSFATAHTVVRKEARVRGFRRSEVTTNRTVLDSVFEPLEETLHVYCNYPPGSDECKRVWIDGAEDTIVRLPDHVGEGPFARLVSIKPAHEAFKLPHHHLVHRSTERLSDPVYEVKIDYNFQAIRPKGDQRPINIRVDYTNLHSYWEEISVGEARRKRSVHGGTPAKVPNWQARVNKAVRREDGRRGRPEPVRVTRPMGNGGRGRHEKRWWGDFLDWLKSLTTMTKSNISVLRLAWADSISLVRSKSVPPSGKCTAKRTAASLEIDLEADVSMDVTFAYYFSGTIIPPNVFDAYAYLGMEPNAYIGLRMAGHAEMEYRSERRPIIDTITYPGLAIKGLVSIGPTLDLYGQIRGRVSISGQARAGARVNFGKAEVYWPQDDEASKKYQKLLGINSGSSVAGRDFLEPVFEADVELNAGLDVTVQPQANFGIKIGGGALSLGLTLVDAQLSGYLVGGLSFQATSHINYESREIRYSYGVYLIYNLGYTAKAFILDFVGWALWPREVFRPDKRITVYGPVTGSIPWSSPGAGDAEEAQSEDAAAATVVPEIGASTDLAERSIHARGPKGARLQAPPSFKGQVSCPAKRKRKIKLPELRYNCDLLGSTVITGSRNHSDVSVPGLCQAWRKLTPFPAVLTFSDDEERKRMRRKAKCPENYCMGQNAVYQLRTGRLAKTTCSTAPPPSTEEGGDSTYPPSQSRTCVPAFHISQRDEGGCSKLLQNLVSNWGEMEAAPPAKGRTKAWVPWRDDRKWTTASKMGGVAQRATTYPNMMPLPDGMSKRASLRTSWMFRRNYTWSTIDNATDASKWWDASSYRFNASSAEDPDGWGSILCALNTFGQNSVYRLTGGHNAFCLRSSDAEVDGFQRVRRVAPCRVTFRGDQGSSSKSSWEVDDIKFAEDTEANTEDDTEADALVGNLLAEKGSKGAGYASGTERA